MVLFSKYDSASIFCGAHVSSAALTRRFSCEKRFIQTAACCWRVTVFVHNLKGSRWHICVRKELWSLSATQKHKSNAKGNIYINSDIKGRNNVAPHCSVCQQSDAASPDPKLICPHRQRGWEERTRDCVLFLPPASQTVALTKYPFCAVSFHSDWTNWDLLTANPIRAGTGQSHPGICHPWHTGLPLPSQRPLSLWPQWPLAFFNMESLIKSPKTGRFGEQNLM